MPKRRLSTAAESGTEKVPIPPTCTTEFPPGRGRSRPGYPHLRKRHLVPSRARDHAEGGGGDAANGIRHALSAAGSSALNTVSQVSKVFQVVIVVEISAILALCWQNEAPSRLVPLPRRGRPVRTNLGNGPNGSPDCGSDSWRKGRGNGNGQRRPERRIHACEMSVQAIGRMLSACSRLVG